MTVSGVADPDGWRLWDYSGTGEWPEQWPPVEWRAVDERRVAFRLVPPAHCGNLFGLLHGAFLAGVAEQCIGLFIEPKQGSESVVTVSLNLDYPAAGRTGVLLEGEAELLRETGRMQFVRVDLRQEDALIVSASGVLRKVPRP